jgi:LETM1 and EF-hand domain-containing protein 1
VTKDELVDLAIAVEKLTSKKQLMSAEQEEIRDLKEELSDYKEDVEDLNVLKTTSRIEVRESKAARRLYKRVNKMIEKMDSVVSELQQEESSLKAQLQEEGVGESKKSQLIATEKLIEAIQKFRTVSDPARLERIADVVGNLDADRDGHVELDDVMKVIELIGRENVNLNPQQVAEIVAILGKEESFAEKRAKSESQKIIKEPKDISEEPSKKSESPAAR